MVFFFLMELPYFHKNILEALREPMQDRVVNIARVNSKVSYKADFMFVSAMNPCPCGNMLSKINPCRCNEKEIKRYRARLSEPFLDRIDIFVVMQEINSKDRVSMDSISMHEMVINAFLLQKNRGQKSLNGKLGEKELEKYAILEINAEEILSQAIIDLDYHTEL